MFSPGDRIWLFNVDVRSDTIYAELAFLGSRFPTEKLTPMDKDGKTANCGFEISIPAELRAVVSPGSGRFVEFPYRVLD